MQRVNSRGYGLAGVLYDAFKAAQMPSAALQLLFGNRGCRYSWFHHRTAANPEGKAGQATIRADQIKAEAVIAG